MQGYRSQYEEISMWVDADDIEGSTLHVCASQAHNTMII